MTDIAATDLCQDATVRRDILGVDVCDLTRADALAMLCAMLEEGRHRRVTFLNAHSANIAARDEAFREALSRFMVLSDGIGVDIAAQLLHGRHFRANLNGTDFVPALLNAAPFPLRVGLYGGRPGIAEQAAAGFAALDPRHDYRALAHGYGNADDEMVLLKELADWKPDVLLVALGVPAQEMWIARAIAPAHCTIAMSVGALFDFFAGAVPRAPRWVRRVRMEWVYRLALEPGRLWRRYLLGNPEFLGRVIGQKLAGRRRSENR
jgi:exopolysaccharide biosynthesis WecB/TagA/CpsF family protein